MELSVAVVKRIQEFIDKSKGSKEELSISCLALKSNMTPSTLFDIMNGVTKNVQVYTIKKICFGLDITLQDFFSPDYFNDFEDCIN